jgi:hypothetical protein
MIVYTGQTPVRNPKKHLPEPDIDADFAVRKIAVKFALEPHIAALIVSLAQLGGGHQ